LALRFRLGQVALWNQKLNDGVVVWDYHVILVLMRTRDERAKPVVANDANADLPVADAGTSTREGADGEDGDAFGCEHMLDSTNTDSDTRLDAGENVNELESDEARRSVSAVCCCWVYDFDSRAGMPCGMEGEHGVPGLDWRITCNTY
jgi:hypothetical protein